MILRHLQRRGISIFAALHGSSSSKKYRIFTQFNHLELHPQWLRERCLSPLSVQQETLQPLHQPHEFCWPMDIETAALTDNDTILRIRFSDGHDSTFEVQDLETEAASLANCGVQQKDNKMPTPVLWTDAEVMRIPYEDLVDGVHGEDQDHPDGIRRFNLFLNPNTAAIEYVLTFHLLYRHLLYRHWIILTINTALTRPTVSFGSIYISSGNI